MTTTPTTTVHHGITVNEVRLPAGTPLQASCLCGWQSPIVPSRPRAIAAGSQHEAEASYGSGPAAPQAILSETERARQDGYDSGYEDGVSIAPQQLLTPDEAASLADLERDTLDILAALHVGPVSFHLGSQRLYRRSEVRAWMVDFAAHVKDVGVARRNLDAAMSDVTLAADSRGRQVTAARVTCPAWCANNPTSCSGEHSSDMLTLAATANGPTSSEASTDGVSFPGVSVRASMSEQDRATLPPSVCLHLGDLSGDMDHEVFLRPDEARALAENLRFVLDSMA